tara:strand:- start:3 stop:572 length:570 start_codon:yes stop_codon:yes gene_type:complete
LVSSVSNDNYFQKKNRFIARFIRGKFLFIKVDYFTRNKLKTLKILDNMKLTTKGRYAVMAMADLAANQNGKPVSLTDISLRQNISLSYLEQLFLKLKNEKLVKSIRGASGGYILDKNPKDIRISNIIFAVDEKVKTLNCKRESKKGCHGKTVKCITHNLWDDLEKHINQFFEKVSLNDLVKDNKMEMNK